MTDLLGEPTDPSDLDLGPVQRLVMRELRRLKTLASDEAGAIAHAHRGKHRVEGRCMFCASDGRVILQRLAQLGLCERGAEGSYQVPREGQGTGGGDEFPEGF